MGEFVMGNTFAVVPFSKHRCDFFLTWDVMSGMEPFVNRCRTHSESSLFWQVSIKDVKLHLAAAGVETRLL